MIVPAKDQEAHLGDCLTSLVEQLRDRDALEVIVVDDGSTRRHGRHRRDLRVPAAGAAGAAQRVAPSGWRRPATRDSTGPPGRYLAFLDGDDWLARGHLARMVSAISTLEVDFVRTDHVQTTDGQRVVVRAPEARRHRVLDPRESILPMTTLDDGRLLLRLGRHLRPADRRTC